MMMKSSSCHRNQRVWLAMALVIYLSGISLPSCSGGLVVVSSLLPVAEARTTTSPREREERRRRIEERKRQKEFKKRKQEEQEQKENRRRQKERDQANKQRKQREQQHRRASSQNNNNNNTSSSSNDGQAEEEEFPFESVKNFAMGFITEQPKDIMEGTIKGIKSLLVGGTVGLVSFVGLPIISVYSQYQDDGDEPHPILAGIVGGILGGLTGSVSTLAGIGLSLYQVGTGLWNTVWAVKAQVSGMRWHPANRTWAYYSIQDEAEELNMKGGKIRSGSVVDSTYYELLEVDPTASRGQIKRAYYKKAKVMHPDKNLEDPEKAAEDFLMLHKVYDTLSDEQKRADYDKYGIMAGDSNDDNQINPSVFFAVMYDFQKVEPYIGELAIASFINGFIKCTQMENSQDGLLTFLQEVFMSGDANPVPRRRQLEIAQNLISRIQKYVDGEQTKDEFRQDAKAEALAITTPASSSSSPSDDESSDESTTTTPTDDGFTVKILEAIGAGIKLEAGRFRSNSLPVLGWPMGLFYMLNQKKNGVAGKISSYSKTIKLLRSTYDSGFIRWDQETQNFKVMEAETPEGEPEMTAKAMGLLPDVVDTAGAYILNDISRAVQGACWRIFFDTGVDRKTRSKRAEALEILGQEFLIQARLSNNKNRILDEECEDKEAHSEQVKNKIIRAYEIAQMSANGGGYHDDQEQ